MSVIETTTFRLRADVDEAAFLGADQRVQTEFLPNHPGFLRRTTARGTEGEWIVVTLWASASDAEASAGRATGDAVMRAYTDFLEPGTEQTRRYATLD